MNTKPETVTVVVLKRNQELKFFLAVNAGNLGVHVAANGHCFGVGVLTFGFYVVLNVLLVAAWPPVPHPLRRAI